MIKKISKTDEIRKRLRKEGKLRILNDSEHLEAMALLNKELQDLHRESLVKQHRSEQSARNTIVNLVA